jgi:hypothetical protein
MLHRHRTLVLSVVCGLAIGIVGTTFAQQQKRRDTTRARQDATTHRSDSTASAALSHFLASRTKHDSISFLSAVRTGGAKTATWPTGPTPTVGAILPQKRIVAFYGNPLVKKMGILGEIPPDQMLARLDSTVAQWRAADPATPVQPALQLITVVAQGAPGRDGKYRLRMDSSLIEQVYGWAQKHNALLFLDVQTGKSTVSEELPRLMKFLERPNVHLAVDPEFSMHYEKEGIPPGKKIGVLAARDVNYLVEQLAALVTEKKLPPKVLIVHRFTRPMLHGAAEIKLDPRVQVVMNMDGFGPPWLKFDSYRDYIVREPVQFTGFKIFFHNDGWKGDKLITPIELLQLRPRPMYIQYQ